MLHIIFIVLVITVLFLGFIVVLYTFVSSRFSSLWLMTSICSLLDSFIFMGRARLSDVISLSLDSCRNLCPVYFIPIIILYFIRESFNSPNSHVLASFFYSIFKLFGMKCCSNLCLIQCNLVLYSTDIPLMFFPST